MACVGMKIPACLIDRYVLDREAVVLMEQHQAMDSSVYYLCVVAAAAAFVVAAVVVQRL